MSEARERPILFSGEMVRAILDGRKTQTRRVVTPQPSANTAYVIAGEDGVRALCISALGNGEYAGGSDPWRRCPYGAPGDRLWVKETFWTQHHGPPLVWEQQPLHYAADVEDPRQVEDYAKRPSIFMPRWASRITLEITEVRVERVQEISAEDVAAEGVEIPRLEPDRGTTWYEGKEDDLARHPFSLLWDSINAKRGYSWETNPWVWAVTFRVLEVAG